MMFPGVQQEKIDWQTCRLYRLKGLLFHLENNYKYYIPCLELYMVI